MASRSMNYDQLLKRVRACVMGKGPFNGVLFRSCSPCYANEKDLLTGEGSRKFGGRWNPVEVAAIYGSMTPETALAETLAYYRYSKFPVHAAMPRTFVALQVHLQKVMDLTLGSVRLRLRVSEARMLGEDWRKQCRQAGESLTQNLGQAIFTSGCEAMMIRSAADPKGCNLVIFPDNMLPGSRLEVMQKEKPD